MGNLNRDNAFDSSAVKKAIHDLNNLFTGNLATIEKLKATIINKDDTEILIATLFSNYHRSLEIIETLTGKNNTIKNRISISELLTDVTNSFNSTLSKSASVNLSIEKDLPKIDGNYTELYRLFLNLLTNAKDALKEKGEINVKATYNKNSEEIIISVIDNGVGIKPENLNPIFSEGFSTKKGKYVSGYGLSIVKQIIENHNGKIEVSSELNKGSTFTLYFPISKKTELAVDAKKILLVDDDVTILELLSELLTSYNYNVTSVESGEKALSVFNKNNFDLIIIDKIMKDMDGLELVKKIMNKNRNVPIILTTGSYETIDSDLTELGITKKIKKPFDFEQILSEINSILF